MFKDDMESDLKIFVEMEEFAEEMDIDGVKMPAQMMTMSKARSELVRNTFAKLEGDFSELFFRTADYVASKKRLPRYGEWCFINGKRYDVISSQDELGLAHLILGAYRQPMPR